MTVTVTKKIAGEIAPGYPRTYYGQQTFEVGNVSYPSLSQDEFSLMSNLAYLMRLNAFVAYVQSQENGLNIENVQTNTPNIQS